MKQLDPQDAFNGLETNPPGDVDLLAAARIREEIRTGRHYEFEFTLSAAGLRFGPEVNRGNFSARLVTETTLAILVNESLGSAFYTANKGIFIANEAGCQELELRYLRIALEATRYGKTGRKAFEELDALYAAEAYPRGRLDEIAYGLSGIVDQEEYSAEGIVATEGTEENFYGCKIYPAGAKRKKAMARIEKAIKKALKA